MEKDIQNIILNKDFHSLTEDELKIVLDFCQDENDYINMKHFFQSLNEKNYVSSVDSSIKNSLDKEFELKFGSYIHKSKTIQLRTWAKIAAILIVVLITVPFIFKNTSETLKPEVAENKRFDSFESKGMEEERKEFETNGLIESKNSNKEKVVESEFSKTKKNEAGHNDFELNDEVVAENENFSLAPSTAEMKSEEIEAMPIVKSEPASRYSENKFSNIDGVFNSKKQAVYSISVEANPDVLDLLTTLY